MGVETRGMSDEAASQEAINAIRTLSKTRRHSRRFQQAGRHKEDIIEGWLIKACRPVRAVTCAPPAAMKFASCTEAL